MLASPMQDALSPFILALVSKGTPKIFPLLLFQREPPPTSTNNYFLWSSQAVIGSNTFSSLFGRRGRKHRSSRATLILGTNSKGTQLKDLAGGLRFACRVLCVFSRDQSDCEKLWFSIHFFAYGKEDGVVQWLFKNTSKELESVHGCTIYNLK